MSRPMWPRNYSQRVSIYNLLILKIGKISITLTYHRQNCPTGQPSTKKVVFFMPDHFGSCHKSKEKLGKFHIKCQTSMARWGGIPKWLPNDPLCSPFDPKNRIVSLGPGHFKNLGRPGSTSYRLAAVAFSATMNWGQRVGGGRRF